MCQAKFPILVFALSVFYLQTWIVADEFASPIPPTLPTDGADRKGESGTSADQPRATTTPSWVREAAGLRMEIKPVRETFSVGDDLLLELSITNDSESPIHIWMHPVDDPKQKERYATATVVVKTPDDREIRLQRPVFRQFVPLVLLPLDYPRHELKPKETYRESIVLNQWTTAGGLHFKLPQGSPAESAFPALPVADFTRPGKYTIDCEYLHYPAVEFDGKAHPTHFDPRRGQYESDPKNAVDPTTIRVQSQPVTIMIREGAKSAPAADPPEKKLSAQEHLQKQIERFTQEAAGLRNAGRLEEAKEHADKAQRLRERLRELKRNEQASRIDYLHGQVTGLLKEAKDLHAAGRLEEAKQHAEKAAYRLGQIQELEQKSELQQGVEKLHQGAADAEFWGQEEQEYVKSPPISVTLVAADDDAKGQDAKPKDVDTSQNDLDRLRSVIQQAIRWPGEAMTAPAALRMPRKQEGLALEVEFDSRDYLLAEPLLVRCSLVNTSEKPITLSYGSRYEQANTIFFDIEGPGGEKFPWSSDVRLDSPGPQPQTILPGKRYVEYYDLLDHYALTKAGTYKINVRYESDGKSFNPSSLRWRDDLWKGKREVQLEPVKIIQPTWPDDQAALKALRAQTQYGVDSPFHFLYLYYAESETEFNAFLEKHGDSRYAAYARHANAQMALQRVHQGTPSYAKAALANLQPVDTNEYPALFGENHLVYSIQAHLGAGSDERVTNRLLQELLKRHPQSPLVHLARVPSVERP